MSDLRLKVIDESEMDTLIAEDVEFEGELTCADPALIKGTLDGTIQSTSNVYISDTAVLRATVNAKLVSVRGEIVGDITTSQRLEIFTTGVVEGTIATPDFVVQSGARFNGSCTMPDGRAGKPAAPSSGKAAAGRKSPAAPAGGASTPGAGPTDRDRFDDSTGGGTAEQ